MIDVDYSFNARRVVEGANGEGVYEHVKELAESIKREGQITPVIVRELSDKEREGKFQYKLLCGFRRFEATKMIGLDSITAQIWAPVDPDNLEIEEMFVNLIENEVRKNLKPWEKAQGFYEMKEALKISGRELARRLGESETNCNNLIALWKNIQKNPYLLDVWRKEIETGITGLLVKTLAVGKDKVSGKEVGELNADEQMRAWEEARGVKRAKEDEELGEAKGDTNPQAGKPVRATSKEMKTALERCKDSDKEPEYLKGVRAALKFAMGDKPTIPGVYNPAKDETEETEATA